MPLPTIQFSKSSADPLSIEVHIGDLVFGHYELYLWDTSGTTQKKIGQGVNNDDVPDTLQLPNGPASYDRMTLQWRVDVAPLPTGDSAYKVSVTVRQGTRDLPGGTFAWNGDLGSGKEIIGGAVLSAG